MKSLEPHERFRVTRATIRAQNADPSDAHELFGRNGSQLNLISESGVYKVIMRSEKKEASQFSAWIAKEVLPSIRKTGKYALRPRSRSCAFPVWIAIGHHSSNEKFGRAFFKGAIFNGAPKETEVDGKRALGRRVGNSNSSVF
ncbi:hypothetical protein ATDW_05400 [Asticcacaulis sp. DW145]|uniref:BRO-N domain-containing protein n=1 Tax=Asticcacaulis sp. DW145 TaxID=3095608 RepID=UPI003090D39E|nr:hypothetical protein ATDW_05400 [Asticcacaulis sp. DW145]